MVLLYGINDNIIIPHPSYLGVYQYEKKIITLTRYKYIFGSEKRKK